jgi:hypothetical protein
MLGFFLPDPFQVIIHYIVPFEAVQCAVVVPSLSKPQKCTKTAKNWVRSLAPVELKTVSVNGSWSSFWHPLLPLSLPLIIGDKNFLWNVAWNDGLILGKEAPLFATDRFLDHVQLFCFFHCFPPLPFILLFYFLRQPSKGNRRGLYLFLGGTVLHRYTLHIRNTWYSDKGRSKLNVNSCYSESYCSCKIWGFRGGDYKEYRRLGCYAAWF